jgi:predicted HTH transcriptional regulator
MQSARIHDLLELGPGERIVFVRDAPAPDEIAALIASLANTQGGTIIVGAQRPQSITGVRDPQAALKRISQGADRVRPALVIDPQIATHDGKTLILLHVPQGYDTPYVGADGRVLVRNARRSVAATPQQAAELAQRAIENAALIPIFDRETTQRLQRKSVAATIDLDQIIDKLERLIVANAELTRRLDQANSWHARFMDQMIGAAMGFVVSILIYLIGLN